MDGFLCVCLNPTIQNTLLFDRIARDDVNRARASRVDASGKGVNAARVLGRLGRRAAHLTHLGGRFASAFRELCAADGIDLRWVDSLSEIRFCCTALEEGDASVTELVQEAEPVGPGTEAALLGLFESMAADFGTLVVSGSKAAGYSPAAVPAMAASAKAKGLRVVLDVRGRDLTDSLSSRPDVVKPNLKEFLSTFLPEEAARLEAEGPAYADSPLLRGRTAAAMEGLSRDFGCAVVVTRGSRPAWAVGPGGFEEIPFAAVRPVNTTGSGDAFTAGLAAALDAGAPLRDAVLEGARCGAANAALLKPGDIVA